MEASPIQYNVITNNTHIGVHLERIRSAKGVTLDKVRLLVLTGQLV